MCLCITCSWASAAMDLIARQWTALIVAVVIEAAYTLIVDVPSVESLSISSLPFSKSRNQVFVRFIQFAHAFPWWSRVWRRYLTVLSDDMSVLVTYYVSMFLIHLLIEIQFVCGQGFANPKSDQTILARCLLFLLSKFQRRRTNWSYKYPYVQLFFQSASALAIEWWVHEMHSCKTAGSSL